MGRSREEASHFVVFYAVETYLLNPLAVRNSQIRSI